MVFLGGTNFPLLFCWVVSAWSLSLGGVASGPLSFCVVLPSFSPFWWCCFLSPLLMGVVAWPPSLSGVALFPLLLRGAAFLSLLPWVGLVSLPSSVGWCCLPSPPLGGAAFPLLFSWVVLLGLLRWVVLRYSLSFCVVLPSFTTFFGRVSFKKKNQKIEKNEVKNKNRNKEKQRGKTK